MTTDEPSYMDRMTDWCSFHIKSFSFAAADSLDNGFVDLREAFNRYDSKCRMGQGCDR